MFLLEKMEREDPDTGVLPELSSVASPDPFHPRNETYGDLFEVSCGHMKDSKPIKATQSGG